MHHGRTVLAQILDGLAVKEFSRCATRYPMPRDTPTLSAYTADKPLANMVALEPSAGDGAFLCGMVRRLVDSCKRHRIPLSRAGEALRAYDIDPNAIASAIETVRAELVRLEVEAKTASSLAKAWIRKEDFLEASLGFPVADFVIGNPPYIRLEEIPEGKADLYRNAYSTMRGRADIYVAFFQAALAQLRPGGVCAYICADRWLLNDYGRALRTLITEGYSVRYIIETHDVDASVIWFQGMMPVSVTHQPGQSVTYRPGSYRYPFESDFVCLAQEDWVTSTPVQIPLPVYPVYTDDPLPPPKLSKRSPIL